MAEAFGATSTADDVLRGQDLTGRRYLVTGVSAGIGVETARALAAHGADVVAAVRDIDKAQKATADIGVFRERTCLDFVELDLADLASVRACAEQLVARGDRFDAVIANAGIMATPFGRTKDGFELQFGTNHLGHFVFVNRLLPLLDAGSRVVMVSSAGHRNSNVDLEDPGFETTEYSPFISYSRSKTANIQFAVEFDRRHRDAGIRATAVHPGVIHTELTRHLDPDMQEQSARLAAAAARGDNPAGLDYKSVEQGAATQVWAAVAADADAVGGRFCVDCHVAEVSDEEGNRRTVQPYAVDPEKAKALWALSEEMVRERF